MEKQQLVEIGQRLRQKRNELGLTRERFAELADIGAGYYGQLEVGTSQMSIDTLIKISRAMHLPMEYILFGNGYEPGMHPLCSSFCVSAVSGSSSWRKRY